MGSDVRRRVDSRRCRQPPIRENEDAYYLVSRRYPWVGRDLQARSGRARGGFRNDHCGSGRSDDGCLDEKGPRLISGARENSEMTRRAINRVSKYVMLGLELALAGPIGAKETELPKHPDMLRWRGDAHTTDFRNHALETR